MNNFIIICNLSPSHHRGSHFVTIIGTPNEILYVDSLALPCTISSEVHMTLLKFKRRIKNLITKCIQEAESSYCGFFCIYFACIFDYIRIKFESGIMVEESNHQSS